MPNPVLVSVLARSFLESELAVGPIVERAAIVLGRPWRWLRPLARRYVQSFAGRPRPRHREVVRFLANDDGFHRACREYADRIAIHSWMFGPARMRPEPAAAAWNLPPIESIAELARWLQLTVDDLLWFADLKDLNRRAGSPFLEHYHYRILSKEFGRVRLIEAPKPRLKAVQRRILEQILDPIRPHPAVHGFVRRRSIRTFAAPHVGQRVVLRMDLEDFFPSFSGPRVQSFFRFLGYPEEVADLLGGICTNAAPRSLAGDLYRRPHLPQGAPTSPSLANLCFYRIDCRLSGLAESADACYTRYADDLAFSGGVDFQRCAERFSIHVAAILLEEGFRVHHRKTRIMPQSVRQQLAGVVANRCLNIRRDDFDRLKATLTNCARHGPETQNRDGHPHFRAHLEGRIAFVESIHAERGARLRQLFQRIKWA
jgi:hypothetical protein